VPAFAEAFARVPASPDAAEAARACAAAARYSIERQARSVADLYADLTRTYVRYTIGT
jgi:hypothetical protein